MLNLLKDLANLFFKWKFETTIENQFQFYERIKFFNPFSLFTKKHCIVLAHSMENFIQWINKRIHFAFVCVPVQTVIMFNLATK